MTVDPRVDPWWAAPGPAGPQAGRGAPLSESERDELSRLRGELAETQMEVDVFKRSVALWVKEAMGR